MNAVLSLLSQSDSYHWLVPVLGIIVEFGLRLAKTDKPRSLLYSAADLIRGIANILTKVSQIMDSVLQNVKSDVPVSSVETPKQ